MVNKPKDSSIKIAEQDVLLVNEIKHALRKQGVKVTQKDIIHQGLMLLVEDKKELKTLKKKDNTKELTEKFLAGKKYDFGPNWMEEIDTTL